MTRIPLAEAIKQAKEIRSRERQRVSKRRYTEAHRDKANAQKRGYYEKHRDRLLANCHDAYMRRK